jgi:hypothetical protein
MKDTSSLRVVITNEHNRSEFAQNQARPDGNGCEVMVTFLAKAGTASFCFAKDAGKRKKNKIYSP